MKVSLRPYRAKEFHESLQLLKIIGRENVERRRKNFEGSGTWVDHYQHLAVDLKGNLVGDLQLRRCHSTMPPGVIEIGIEILEEHRGKGIGTQVLASAANKFLSNEIHRICGSTEIENVAMIRAFEKANWTREGILHGLFKIDGQLKDFVSYSSVL